MPPPGADRHAGGRLGRTLEAALCCLDEHPPPRTPHAWRALFMIEARTGQTQGRLSREVFRERFLLRYVDPAYDSERAAILRLEAIAWDAYQQGRKAPHTVAAGAAFADPTYQISTPWLGTPHRRLKAAQSRWADPSTPPQVLVIAGGARNDGTCPGEMSKTWRLAGIVCQEVKVQGLHPDLLDLSLLTSEYGRTIHPCKGCLS